MTDEVQPMPQEVRDLLKAQGLDDAQCEVVNTVGFAIRNSALDSVNDKETMSPAELALCGMACQMVAAWFYGMADDAVAEAEAEAG